jgi:hypothetical protein
MYYKIETYDPRIVSAKGMPAEMYDVSVKVLPETLIAAIGGGIILSIGLLATLGIASGTTGFWVGVGEAASGSVFLILSIFFERYRNEKFYQTLDLPSATSLNKYFETLEKDRNVTYSYSYPNFLDSNYPKKEGKYEQEKTRAQTDLDVGRATYLLNHKPIDDVKDSYGMYYQFANQIFLIDPMAIIRCRYQNDELNIHFSQKQFKKEVREKNTQFDLVNEGGKWYLDISQFYEIFLTPDQGNRQCLKYLKANVRIDLQTDNAIITWTSPQKDIPKH